MCLLRVLDIVSGLVFWFIYMSCYLRLEIYGEVENWLH